MQTAECLTLHIDVGQDSVQPAREPRDLVAQQGEDGWHEGQADDEGVEQDGDREAESDHLDHGLVRGDEPGEDSDHDECGRDHDPGAVPEAGGDRRTWCLPLNVCLTDA